MSWEELINYIRVQLNQGATKGQITQILLAQGYLPQDIDEAFSLALKPSVYSKFFSPIDLLKGSWVLYKKGIKTFLALELVLRLVLLLLLLVFAVLIFLFLLILRKGFSLTGCLIFGGILALPVALLTYTWYYAALLRAISAEGIIGIKEIYRLSRPYILPLLYVFFLTGIAVTAGSFLFIVPAVIFFVWFNFSQLVLINEGLQGLKALQKSREYVRGRWWGVFGRIVFIMSFSWIVIWVPTIIFQYFLKIDLLASAYWLLISIFLPPFTTIYSYLLYLNLRSPTSESSLVPTKEFKRPFYKIFIVGLVILVISFILILNNPAKIRDEVRESSLSQIKAGLDSYFGRYQAYPASLKNLEADFAWKQLHLRDPKTGSFYKYQLQEGGKDYQLCLTFEKGEIVYQCFTSNSSPNSKKFQDKIRRREAAINKIREFLNSYFASNNKYPSSFTYEDLNKLQVGADMLVNPETGFYTGGSWYYSPLGEGQDYKFCVSVGEGPHRRNQCFSGQGSLYEEKVLRLIPITPTPIL